MVKTKTSNSEERQRRIIHQLKQKEHWMKWAIIGALVVILLLLLFLGYATDWTKGLNKDATTGTPIEAGLDAANGSNVDTIGENGGGRSTTSSETGSNTGTTTNNTTRETSTNTTTTTNNNTTTQPTGSTLLDLYSDANAGDSIDDILGLANELGVEAECQNELLVQVCTFNEDGFTVTTKNLLGSGVLTSVTKNF